jgi:hypothetical protein
MTTITTDDINNPAYRYAVLSTEHDSPYVQSLHATEGKAQSWVRRNSSGQRIASLHLAVAPLEGPAPHAYRGLYTSMRQYLLDS